VVPLLRQGGHEVTGVARSSAGRAQLVGQGAAALDLDLFDPAAVRGAVAGHDAVVNLATHIPRSTVQMFLRWSWRSRGSRGGCSSRWPAAL
jgi:putative NADH-flavin reductase